MNLLSLLQELEPDAGWQGLPVPSSATTGSEAAWSGDDRAEYGPHGFGIAKVTILGATYRSLGWRKCEAITANLRTALTMALAGYRAGETT